MASAHCPRSAKAEPAACSFSAGDAGRDTLGEAEVRSGGSYYSQNDLRVHFGLGKATKIKTIEVRWPSGTVDTINDLNVNQSVQIKEGAGIVKPAAMRKEAP